MNITIIIPFYQRKPGLLKKSVASVISQKFSGNCSIIVVDDGSPVSAAQELEGFAYENTNFKIRLIQKSNAGVARARNSALDKVDTLTDVVAFLDSDDEFGPGRLALIETAFSQGADFLFSNTIRPASNESAFDECDFFYSNSAASFNKISDELYVYTGSVLDLVLTNCPFGGNSIVYRWKGCEAIRFPTEYSNACEDRLFAWRILNKAKTVIVSPKTDVILGVGVNIWASSVWGTENGIVRIIDTCRFHRQIANEAVMSEEQKELNSYCLRSLDHQYLESLVVFAVRVRSIRSLALFFRYVAMRPFAIFSLPKVLMTLLRNHFVYKRIKNS